MIEYNLCNLVSDVSSDNTGKVVLTKKSLTCDAVSPADTVYLSQP